MSTQSQPMDFNPPLIEGVLIQRYKRFLADVELGNGQIITAHCPNPGAMTACAEPGWKVGLSYSADPKRKLAYTLEMTHNGQSWIGVNTQRANQLVAEALQENKIPELSGYQQIQSEVKYGDNSRIDFLLRHGEADMTYVEVKSATLKQGDWALFPDSVTARGKKHLEELIKMKNCGHRALMLFVVQREDVTAFQVADQIDPAYASALKTAKQAGVEVFVYKSKLNLTNWKLDQAIPKQSV